MPAMEYAISGRTREILPTEMRRIFSSRNSSTSFNPLMSCVENQSTSNGSRSSNLKATPWISGEALTAWRTVKATTLIANGHIWGMAGKRSTSSNQTANGSEAWGSPKRRRRFVTWPGEAGCGFLDDLILKSFVSLEDVSNLMIHKWTFGLRKVEFFLLFFGIKQLKAHSKSAPHQKSVVSQQCPLQASHSRSELNPWCFQKMPEMAFLQLPDPSTEIDTQKRSQNLLWSCWPRHDIDLGYVGRLAENFMSTETKSSQSSARNCTVRRFLCHFSNAPEKRKRSWIHHTGLSYRKDIISEPISRWGVFNIGQNDRWEDPSKQAYQTKSRFSWKQKSFHLHGKVSPLSLTLCSDRSSSIPKFLPNILGVLFWHPKTNLKYQWDH